MNVGGLFSGIGACELGLQRAGMQISWMCESEPYCRAVLKSHWPAVPCYRDIQRLDGRSAQPIDLLCGGFPCQDISVAGHGIGIAGRRSSLWAHFGRLIDELRPRYVIVENVAALRGRGLDHVLGTLATLRYDAEWDCIPASAVGAPHRRDRIWIVAYPQRNHLRKQPRWLGGASWIDTPLPRADGQDRSVADAEQSRLERSTRRRMPPLRWSDVEPASSSRSWSAEPNIRRVAYGTAHRLDRIRALGNALIPQIAEQIGRQILSYEKATAPTEVRAARARVV
jgi:DNA (cytosine-5)-methyltransferase 1